MKDLFIFIRNILELFILSLELFILCILNEDGILLYLKHSFSYIFFNPLFSEKQPLILLSGLFIFQKLVYDRLWLFVYNQIFKEGVTILL